MHALRAPDWGLKRGGSSDVGSESSWAGESSAVHAAASNSLAARSDAVSSRQEQCKLAFDLDFDRTNLVEFRASLVQSLLDAGVSRAQLAQTSFEFERGSILVNVRGPGDLVRIVQRRAGAGTLSVDGCVARLKSEASPLDPVRAYSPDTLFDKLDVNSDGVVTREELRQAMRSGIVGPEAFAPSPAPKRDRSVVSDAASGVRFSEAESARSGCSSTAIVEVAQNLVAGAEARAASRGAESTSVPDNAALAQELLRELGRDGRRPPTKAEVDAMAARIADKRGLTGAQAEGVRRMLTDIASTIFAGSMPAAAAPAPAPPVQETLAAKIARGAVRRPSPEELKKMAQAIAARTGGSGEAEVAEAMLQQMMDVLFDPQAAAPGAGGNSRPRVSPRALEQIMRRLAERNNGGSGQQTEVRQMLHLLTESAFRSGEGSVVAASSAAGAGASASGPPTARSSVASRSTTSEEVTQEMDNQVHGMLSELCGVLFAPKP
eukprot:TRINITY_DN24360_c1_g2_i5.p1 TRINITY_DN24360_c1_g2~~TRINITY_DN24360_c1_g2_i5.p1  ORF type:complete len:492 (+),score=115.45 TRINITY_DN24360_c1_g2_i5:145-1620(+)